MGRSAGKSVSARRCPHVNTARASKGRRKVMAGLARKDRNGRVRVAQAEHPLPTREGLEYLTVLGWKESKKKNGSANRIRLHRVRGRPGQGSADSARRGAA